MQEITWNKVASLCQKISKQIKDKYAFIYGIPRGGLPVAVHLSHLTGISMNFDTFGSGKPKYIVVDDINDTGRTMRPHIRNDKCITIALFEREDAECKADIVGEYIHHNDYLVFPWENKERAFEDMIEYLKSLKE